MDTVSIAQFILSFVFVILLILGTAWGAKRFGLERRLRPAARPDARLEIRDQMVIDPRRRLVLIRRDGREHLLLLSTDRELLIESYDVASTDSTT